MEKLWMVSPLFAASLFATNAQAAVTLRCDLAQKALGIESLYLTEFDSSQSILYTSSQDADGGGVIKTENGSDTEILEFSNECDNLFHFELSAAELSAARSAIQAGATDGVVVNGKVAFWLYADEEHTATSSVTCVLDSDFKRTIPGSSTSGR